MVPSDQTRGNGHTLKRRRCRLSIRKHFFAVRVTEHQHRLPREAVESPSLEIFKSYLDMVLGKRSGQPSLSRGVGPPGIPANLNRSVILYLPEALRIHYEGNYANPANDNSSCNKYTLIQSTKST